MGFTFKTFVLDSACNLSSADAGRVDSGGDGAGRGDGGGKGEETDCVL